MVRSSLMSEYDYYDEIDDGGTDGSYLSDYWMQKCFVRHCKEILGDNIPIPEKFAIEDGEVEKTSKKVLHDLSQEKHYTGDGINPTWEIEWKEKEQEWYKGDDET